MTQSAITHQMNELPIKFKFKKSIKILSKTIKDDADFGKLVRELLLRDKKLSKPKKVKQPKSKKESHEEKSKGTKKVEDFLQNYDVILSSEIVNESEGSEFDNIINSPNLFTIPLDSVFGKDSLELLYLKGKKKYEERKEQQERFKVVPFPKSQVQEKSTESELKDLENISNVDGTQARICPYCNEYFKVLHLNRLYCPEKNGIKNFCKNRYKRILKNELKEQERKEMLTRIAKQAEKQLEEKRNKKDRKPKVFPSGGDIFIGGIKVTPPINSQSPKEENK